jgi:hypothetical protein
MRFVNNLFMVVLFAMSAPSAVLAQHLPGGLSGEHPTSPETASCSYSVRPTLGPVRVDRKTDGDDFCNASAAGLVYVGEAEVDYNALASAAASHIGWRCAHVAVAAGPNACAPVSFEDSAHFHSRVETKVTSWFGARHAQAAGLQIAGSSVMSPLVCALLAANNDAGGTATFAFPVPFGGPSGVTLAPISVSIPMPASNTVSADEKDLINSGAKTTELNIIVGASSLAVSAGGASLIGGGGKGKVVFTSATYESTSRCPTHGVKMTFPKYAATWSSTFSGF